jgi:predicted phage terminase large subunit-like protein
MKTLKGRELFELVSREMARRNYADYCSYVNRGQKYEHAAHTRLICRHLEEVVEGRNKRKMFFLPPRHGKSLTITETFPAYYLSKNKTKRVIATAYGEDLSIKFGRKNRDKVIEYGDLFDIAVNPNKSAGRLWEIDGTTGGMLSTQIGAGITGHGADLLLIDDPVKNEADASSQTHRDHVYNEYQATLRTRLHAGGSIVLIMTRWHEDDLAGRLLRGEEEWDVISLPALCEDASDLLGREIGEPLWSEGGYDKEWAERTKREVGSRTWAALYQQRPAPAEGSIFKRHWWQRYSVMPPRFDQLIQSWDLTFKGEAKGDYVVGQVWGMIGADAYLIDQMRGQWDFVETQKAIERMTKKHPRTSRKYIEEAANGAAIIRTLKNQIGGIIPVKPIGSKEARAYAVTPYIEAGNVYLPEPHLAPWIGEFLEEAAAFPNGKNDDQIDCGTQALNQLYKGNAIQVFH